MSVVLSSAALQSLNAQESGEAWLLLVEVDHPDLAQPFRITSDAVNTISNGNTFVPCPFEISLPDDSDEEQPQVRARIDNVGRLLTDALRSITTPASISLSVVLGSSPDTIERGPFDFTLRDVEWDALVLEGVLAYEDFMNEPFPADSFSPSNTPGLFR